MSAQQTRTTKSTTRKQRAQRNPGFQQWKSAGAGPAAQGIRVGFPANRTVEMRYTERVLLNSPLGVIAKYQYRLNSAFDPNFTGTGHQPLAFDQWSTFYNHYVVEETTYQVDIAADNTGPYTFGTYISDDSTVPSVPAELLELGGVLANKNAQNAMHLFEGKVAMGKFFNRKDIAADSELRAVVTANPTENCFLTIWSQPSGQSGTGETYAYVTLIMRVRFMEPKDLTSSVTTATPALAPGSTKPGLTTTTMDDNGVEWVKLAR